MGGISYIANVLNQKGAPAIFEDTLANRPAAGYTGRIFISTDTFVIQRDNGTTWDSIGGGGGITGTGATGQVTFFTGASAVSGDNGLFWDNTNKRLGINTITPGVRLDIHGTGVIAQFNGTTTNNAYLDFQNAGTTQWRVGNNYNGGSKLFQIIDTASSLNTFFSNGIRQIGFNSPVTTFLNSTIAYAFHGSNGVTSTHYYANSSTATVFSQQSHFVTKNNTFGSYGATVLDDYLYQLTVAGSTGSNYAAISGAIYWRQSGTVGSCAPTNMILTVANASGVTNTITLKEAGSTDYTGRINVNNATDNANFELNNNGNFNTSGLTLGFITLSSNTTLTRTMSGILVTATCTLTLPTVTGLGNIYYIFVASGVTATINRSGSSTITNKTGTTGLTSLTIVGGTSTMLYIKGGDGVTYQFF
jgi:hypothetical protein